MINKESLQKAIDQAIQVLETGGILLYPADTIWGIGCDASQPDAIRRVYEIKGRQFDKPLIVLVADIRQLYTVATQVHPRVDTLLQFHERPLTVIYAGTTPAYRHLAAKDGSIGVRVVQPGFCHDLITQYGKPLVSTSANASGTPSPTTFGTISSDIIRQVDYALPAFAEKDMSGRPSVIAKCDAQGELDFIR